MFIFSLVILFFQPSIWFCIGLEVGMNPLNFGIALVSFIIRLPFTLDCWDDWMISRYEDKHGKEEKKN